MRRAASHFRRSDRFLIALRTRPAATNGSSDPKERIVLPERQILFKRRAHHAGPPIVIPTI